VVSCYEAGRNGFSGSIARWRAWVLPISVSSSHCSFPAMGITTDLTNGGTLEHAQQIAAQASSKTMKLDDRTADTISLDEIERIVI
jgi:hypothetical protein